MTIQQLSKTAPVTTLLLASFIGLFIMQVLTGVDANEPSLNALKGWGANIFTLTMMNEPWRLVSSGFLHIGLMHLLFNSFAMYFFGQIAEPMFGSVKFLALFLLAVIGGNLLNSQMKWFWVLDQGININQPRIIEMLGLSAGASGGIMGIGAALLIAALFKISVNGMVLNLKSLVFIMGINLMYGFAVPGIDNAGHIGGAITGLMIALAFAIAYRQRMAIALQNTPSLPVFASSYHGFSNNSSFNDTGVNDAGSNDASLNNESHLDNNIGVNFNLNTIANYPIINEEKTPPKSTLIWQLLPWIAMLVISIGFIWWWQDIHQQMLLVITIK